MRELQSIATGDSPIDTELTLFLVQLIIVVTFSKILSYLFKYIKQPSVIAEVVTGLILGESVFGKIPHYISTIFYPSSLTIFGVFANIGLIIFMFMVGLEIDTKLMKKNIASAAIISIASMITPFALSCLMAWILHKYVADDNVSFSSFLLFVGVAISITAFPVLARILTETKLLGTRIGSIALSSAAVNDVVAWILLALVVSIARSNGGLGALWTFLMLILFCIIMGVVVRPLISSVAKRRHSESTAQYNIVMVLLIGMFVCGWITEIIGVHAIFGSFILGVVVPRANHFAAALAERIEDLVVVIFLPLYFTFSGLRTDIGALTSGSDWGYVFLVIGTACIGKISGATFAARFVKCTWRESITVGVLMNTKGLVELIVLNVGLDVGVLNTKIFTMFVIMALVTTFITTPTVYFLYIKNLKREDETEKTHDVFFELLCLHNARTAPSMVILSGLFSKIKTETDAKAILLQQISDRPSSYFFSEFSHAFKDAPILRDKKRKNLLADVKSNAKSVGVQVTTKSFASAELAKDVVMYAESKKYDIVIFEMHHHSATDEIFNMRESKFDMIASVTKTVSHQMEKVAVGESDDIFQSCRSKLKCGIGAMVFKTNNPIESLSKIMFITSKKPTRDLEVLEYFRHLPNTIQFTIVANSKFDLGSLSSVPHFTVLRVGQPFVDFHEHSKAGFDLIIVTGARNTNEIFRTTAINNTRIPTLVLFPPKTAFITGESSVSMKFSEDGVDLPE